MPNFYFYIKTKNQECRWVYNYILKKYISLVARFTINSNFLVSSPSTFPSTLRISFFIQSAR